MGVSIFISLMIGILINVAFLKNTRPIHPVLLFFLSLGLGWGVSAVLTFYAFLVGNGFNEFRVLGLNLAVMGSLILWNIKLYGHDYEALRKNIWVEEQHTVKSILSNLVLIVLFICFARVIITFAQNYPYGNRDAVAVWNMKVKYLLSAGNSWKEVFQLGWYTNPDYPLLLPLINVWNASIIKSPLTSITPATAAIFTLASGGLLYAALRRYTDRLTSFLGAALLMSLEPYIFSGSQQGADTVLAFYLLAGIIALTGMLREKDHGWALLAGIFMGLMTFTKNEGIVLAILFSLISTIYLLGEKKSKRKGNIKLIRTFSVTFLIASLQTLIFKMHIFSWHRPDYLGNIHSATHWKFFNMGGVSLLFERLFEIGTHAHYGFFWALLIVLFLINPGIYFHKEVKVITVSFMSYFIVLCIVYLLLRYLYYTTLDYDLDWLLVTSLNRILVAQIPALIFLHGYAHGHQPRTKG